MARAGRVCNVSGCPRLTAPSSGRCAGHTPSTTERGYGWTHQQRRAQLLPLAWGTPCPVCGTTMHRGDALDLGHSTPLRMDRASVGDRIEHASCNRRDNRA